MSRSLGETASDEALAVVLASQSPRRRALLEACGVQVTVHSSNVDETVGPLETPEAIVLRLAEAKARTVAAAIARPAIVVAADTEVALDGRVLGKPRDEADARAMLGALSGRRHLVLTGLVVLPTGSGDVGDIHREVVQTEVSFRPLTAHEIDAYVRTGEPLDKAGAYGIQGLGGALVDAVFGSYTNVVGLPVAEVLAAVRAVARTHGGAAERPDERRDVRPDERRS